MLLSYSVLVKFGENYKIIYCKLTFDPDVMVVVPLGFLCLGKNSEDGQLSVRRHLFWYQLDHR